MNFFNSLFVHPFLGLAAAASLAIGGGAAIHTLYVHPTATTTASTTIELKGHVSLPSVSVAVGANDHVAVRDATVTGVSGTTVNANSTWGPSTIAWSVNDASAKVTDKEGTTTSASIQTGDTVAFTGTLSSTTSFGVNATTLLDASR